MITRKEYMANSKELFHDYYGQFVTESLRMAVKKAFGVDRLIKAYENDKSLNSIPLSRWDLIPVGMCIDVAEYKKSSNGFFAPCDKVCLAKTAAKQIVFTERPDLNPKNQQEN